MGKEQIIFRDTREKVESRRDKKDGAAGRSFRREPIAKKNISKKDSDKVNRLKKHQRFEKLQ
jgi:hypothetical protein